MAAVGTTGRPAVGRWCADGRASGGCLSRRLHVPVTRPAGGDLPRTRWERWEREWRMAWRRDDAAVLTDRGTARPIGSCHLTQAASQLAGRVAA